jgi:hypothetical protein
METQKTIDYTTLPLEFKVGDRFHYPEDKLGITVDYELKSIKQKEGNDMYIFKPLSNFYMWKGQKFNLKNFELRKKEIFDLLYKGVWIPLKTN